MKTNASLFSKGKIRCFVFDNIDLIFEQYQNECIAIYKEFCKSKTNDEKCIQVVVTSRTWHKFLANILRNISNPLLLIGNFLEAAMYASMKICLEFTHKAQKCEKILSK